MEFSLFIAFAALSLVLIAMSLYAPHHIELGFCGFLFLFLLSLVVINGNLTYKTAEIVTTTNEFDTLVSLPILVNSTATTTYVYSNYEDAAGFFTTHRLGYVMAVISAIGMIGFFVSMKEERWFK